MSFRDAVLGALQLPDVLPVGALVEALALVAVGSEERHVLSVDQRLGPVVRDREEIGRVVPGVEQHRPGVARGEDVEPAAQPVGVGVVRLPAEVGELRILGGAEPLAGSGQHWVDQLVVLAPAHEHRAQHPRHRRLGQLFIVPRCPASRRAPRLRGSGMLVAQPSLQPVDRGHLLAQVVLQPDHLASQVRQQLLAIDHAAPTSSLIRTGHAGARPTPGASAPDPASLPGVTPPGREHR
jgi:hypothetical protein